MAFDFNSMMGDLGFGDPTSGDSSAGGMFLDGTSDSSDPSGSSDPYNTSYTDPGSYSNPDPSGIPSGLGNLGNGLSGLGNGLGMALPGLMQFLGGMSGYTTSKAGIDQIQGLIKGADPWGSSGGRAMTDTKLMEMLGSGAPMPNLNQTDVTKLPGYQAGLDAVQRSMASNGYLGSGNMMDAMMQYGGQAYQQNINNQQMVFQDWMSQLGQYGQMGGAGVTPGGQSAAYMNILGQAEASKNASLMNGLIGLTGGYRPSMGVQQQGGGGGGGGGGGDGLGGLLGAGMSLIGAFL